MKAVSTVVQKSSSTDSPVLIRGETGTGKELAARAIHETGPRSSELFVTQNCAAISPSLLESELFGHCRGAFTGANSERAGLFEAADGGTIFLDEIADASPQVQASLLRILQSGEVRRIGENRSRHVNVRVIAATNQDLEGLVDSGAFREDLYYRLRVIELVMPALRDRREDIPLLAFHLARKAAESEGKSFAGFAVDAIGWLTSREWKGNVRELENEIRRAVAMAGDGEAITVDAFTGGGGNGRPSSNNSDGQRHDLKTIMGNVERSILETSLNRSKGNVAEAARSLGLTRPGLHKKLKRYGIR